MVHGVFYGITTSFPNGKVAAGYDTWMGQNLRNVLAQGHVNFAELVRLDGSDERPSFSVLYTFPDRNALEAYKNSALAAQIRREAKERFGVGREGSGVSIEARVGELLP